MYDTLKKYMIQRGQTFYVSERGIDRAYKITYSGHGIFRKESETPVSELTGFCYQAKNF